MLLGALVLTLLSPVPPAVEGPKPPMDARAECLRSCAGAPGDATGALLLQCLRRCDAPEADAGVK